MADARLAASGLGGRSRRRGAGRASGLTAARRRPHLDLDPPGATTSRELTPSRRNVETLLPDCERSALQVFVAFPPKGDSDPLRHEQSEPLLAAAGALRSEARRRLENGTEVKRQPAPADDERARIVRFCGGRHKAERRFQFDRAPICSWTAL